MDIIDTYQEIKEVKVSEYKRISMVQSTIDNLYYIKRELLYYDKEVYLQLQQLPSINIPKIIHIKEKEGRLIVIEEYINAPTLDVYITNQDINEEESVNMIKQLCDCLTLLHTLKNPIIHRDIKPENIFYDRGRVILFDFDIARVYSHTKNKDTVILGSVGYASPEQFGFGQSNIRSDIYAMGVLLNVLLTNNLPQESLFQGKYKKVIIKATSVDQNNRYRSVEEFKKALDLKKMIIPGVNNDTYKHQILSVVGYLFIIIISVNVKSTEYTFSSSVIFSFTVAMYLLGIEFLMCNPHLNILYSKKNVWMRSIGMIVTYFIYLFLITSLSLFVDSML